jgi:hypothetical protein
VSWRAASTVSTVITIPTSTSGIPPGARGRTRGFGPHRRPGATALLPRRHPPSRIAHGRSTPAAIACKPRQAKTDRTMEQDRSHSVI